MVTSNISDTDEPTVDVLVIGAGSSGAVVTHTAAAAGLSVICVEQGDCVNPSDFPANHPEWELLIQHDWAHDPERARTALGLPRRRHRLRHVAGDVQRRRREFRLLRRRVATEAAPRTSASRHSADDWPISYDDLKPYHDEVDEFIGVSGVGGATAYPEGLD